MSRTARCRQKPGPTYKNKTGFATDALSERAADACQGAA